MPKLIFAYKTTRQDFIAAPNFSKQLHTVFNFGLRRKWGIQLVAFASGSKHLLLPPILLYPYVSWLLPFIILLQTSGSWKDQKTSVLASCAKMYHFRPISRVTTFCGRRGNFLKMNIIDEHHYCPGYLSLTIDSSNLIAIIAVSNVCLLGLRNPQDWDPAI